MISSIKKFSYQHLYMTTCICPIIFFFLPGIRSIFLPSSHSSSRKFSFLIQVSSQEWLITGHVNLWIFSHFRVVRNYIKKSESWFSSQNNVEFISFGVNFDWKFLKGWWMGRTRWLKEGIVELTDKNASCFTAGCSGSLSVKSNLLSEMCKNWKHKQKHLFQLIEFLFEMKFLCPQVKKLNRNGCLWVWLLRGKEKRVFFL